MPKQIKFNLIIDKKPIRGIDDLQENFNIEDILEAHRNGSLERWLLVRGEDKKAAELGKIKGDAVEAAKEICRIFDERCTKEKLEQAAYPFIFKQEFNSQLEKMASLKNQRDEIILSYHDGYKKLLDAMEVNGNNYAFLKAAINEIFIKFRSLYQLDTYRLYKRFISQYPLVILAFLANRSPEKEPIFPKPFDGVFEDINISALLEDDTKKLSDYFQKWDQKAVNPEIKECRDIGEMLFLMVKNNEKIVVLNKKRDGGKIYSVKEIETVVCPFKYFLFSEIAGTDNEQGTQPHIKVFSGETEGYWKDVEPKGRWMIIKMEHGNFIRSLGKKGEELKAEDVNGKFPILEGIDYQSKYATNQLIYMEV